MNIKLNPKEQRVLKAMQDGRRMGFIPYQGRFNPHAYYYIDKIGHCTREAKKLIKLELILHEHIGLSKSVISLTDAGKEFKCVVDDPIDIWSIDTSSTYGGVSIKKYKGYIKANSFEINGTNYRETTTRSFFTDRDKAFEMAIKMQQDRLQMLNNRVKHEEKHLTTLEDQKLKPELDASGYL